jgi:HD-GYP domain-containing protein (c-di-GMP phosphodiesterase class II)
MPLVSIREARSWHRVRHPVFGAKGAVMLAAGPMLTPALARRLVDLGYEWLYVCDREVPEACLKPVLPDDVRSQTLRALETAFQVVKGPFFVDLEAVEHDRGTLGLAAAGSTPGLSLAHVRERYLRREAWRVGAARPTLGPEIVALSYRLADAAINADVAVSLPFESNRTAETFLLAHSLDVALTAGLLAKDCGYDRDEAAGVVLGALFHDVGYALFPASYFGGRSAGAGPREEDAARSSERLLARARQLHPVLGFLLLKEQRNVDLLAAHVAYQHHEHQDGSGFPRGLRGLNELVTREQAVRAPPSQVHRYAAIVAVANEYDRLTSAPPGGSGLPHAEALRRLAALAGTWLNRAVVERFAAAMPPFPVTHEVWVADGEHAGSRGVVVEVRRRQMEQPVVRLVFGRDGKRIRPVVLDTTAAAVRLSAAPSPAAARVGAADGRPADEPQQKEEV